MGEIFRLRHVHAYPEKKIGWWVYDLLWFPIPVLALRSLNDYDSETEPHSTFSWKDNSKLQRAVSLTCSLLKEWQAFRSSIPGLQDKLIAALEQELPGIVL